MGSNPTLSANLRQTARYALGYGWQAASCERQRRLSTGAASEASAPRKVDDLRSDTSSPAVIAYSNRLDLVFGCFFAPRGRRACSELKSSETRLTKNVAKALIWTVLAA